MPPGSPMLTKGKNRCQHGRMGTARVFCIVIFAAAGFFLAAPSAPCQGSLSGSQQLQPREGLVWVMSLNGGYSIPRVPSLGRELSGPSIGGSLSILPFFLQTPVFQLGARCDIGLIAILANGIKQGEVAAAAGLLLALGPWRALMPYAFGGLTLTEYAVQIATEVSAHEFGAGYRVGGGLRFLVRERPDGATTLSPEVMYGRAVLESVTYEYMHFSLVLSMNLRHLSR